MTYDSYSNFFSGTKNLEMNKPIMSCSKSAESNLNDETKLEEVTSNFSNATDDCKISENLEHNLCSEENQSEEVRFEEMLFGEGAIRRYDFFFWQDQLMNCPHKRHLRIKR